MTNGLNKNTLGSEGLQFRCNKNYSNRNDFTVYQFGPGAGIRSMQGSLSRYAGNVFSIPPSSSALSHFDQQGTNNVDYFVKSLTSIDAPNVSRCTSMPKFELIINAQIKECPIVSMKPPWYNSTGGIIETGMEIIDGTDWQKMTVEEREAKEISFFTNRNNYNAYKLQLENLIDGGSTEDLKAQIELTTYSSVYDLRAELLENSPYLSEAVLLEASSKIDVLSDAMIFEILCANPDAAQSQEVLDYLKTRPVLFPTWMIDYISNHTEGINVKKLLILLMADAHEDMMADAKDIIQDIQNEPNGINHAQLRGWYAQLQDIEADYMIVDDYLELGQNSTALNFMNTILESYKLSNDQLLEYNTMIDYVNWRNNIATNGASIQHASENEQGLLQQIADNGFGVAKHKAQNILNFFYDANYSYRPLVPENNAQKRANTATILNTEVSQEYIKIFPNPANELATIEYNLPCISKKAVISINDISGKKIFESNIEGEHNILILDTKNWSRGNYVYKLICDGISIADGKLSIQK